MIDTFVEQEFAKKIAFDCMLDTNEPYVVLRVSDGYQVKRLGTRVDHAREVFRAEP